MTVLSRFKFTKLLQTFKGLIAKFSELRLKVGPSQL